MVIGKRGNGGAVKVGGKTKVKSRFKKTTEQIELRKFYVGSVAKFGLLYGLFLAFIIGLVILVMGFIGFPLFDAPGSSVSNPIISLYAFIVSFLGFFIISLILALLYNLSARLGGMLHLGLAEYEAPVKNLFVKNKSKSSLTGAGGSLRTGATTVSFRK